MFIKLIKNPIFPWLAVFVLSALLFREFGATNEMSRYATLRAMSDGHTFKINSYQDWTIDWAIKDGAIFSKKPLAPLIGAFRVFFVLYLLSKLYKKHNRDSEGHRITEVGPTTRVLMSLLHQVLPFALLIFFIARWMQTSSSIPPPAWHFFALAALFGQSASLFMNFYFGHGMAAMFALALSFCLYRENYFYAGLFFGLTLLSEYTASLLALPVLFFLLVNKAKIVEFIKGGIAPGILWCFYHLATVGSIFKIPAQFQNPMWIDHSSEVKKLWGMFALPNLNVLVELLVGFERGLLWTQPWVLLALPIVFSKSLTKKDRLFSIYLVTSLVLLLLMNASFNGWHGGATSGPRYLSLILPSFALLVAITYQSLSKFMRVSLWSGLAIALVFRVLVYGSRATAPEGHNLWPWLYQDLVQKDGMKGEIRALSLIAMLVIAGVAIYRRRTISNNN
jgi:hypothetical protein